MHGKIALLFLALVSYGAVADVDGGIAAYSRGDYPAAFSEFSVAASQDYPFAQNMLGTMYARGQGVAQNYELALDWFSRAQVLGSPEAMANLANLAKMYAEGLGVPQNNTIALQYFRDAALDGFQPAILRMAEIYEKGELGVTPDMTISLGWRARLGGGKAGHTPVIPAPAKAVATPEQPGAGKAVNATAPQPLGRGKTAAIRVDDGAQFEKQVFQRIENYQQRERKLFVASTDSTPSIAAYLKELRAELASRLAAVQPPLKPDERMIVSLSILRDGTLKNIELSQGSRNPEIDMRVLASLQRLKHLEPLPAGTGGDAELVVVAVSLPIQESMMP
ncbi:MAG: SEL1-like repeat protein [Betaproteobacteria bacterium]|nr:SEL1-like repeat protein [Betaproteobacteria bacterium]